MTGGLFDIIGPRMIGPSSSHTAGALRIALLAGKLLPQGIRRAVFTLYGSLAYTFRGHGTDRALVAGVLGFRPDDVRIRDSFEIADAGGLRYEFILDTETKTEHPNTVGILLEGTDGRSVHVTGISVGGGNVRLTELDGVTIDLSGNYSTLIIRQTDRPGVVAHITKVLGDRGVNIAFMRLYRTGRGRFAHTVVETDDPCDDALCALIASHPDILSVRRIDPAKELTPYAL